MTHSHSLAPDRTFIIEIDGQEFQTSDPTLTAAQIKAMAGRPDDHLVYRLTLTQEQHVAPGDITDLRGTEVERFRTAPPTLPVPTQPLKINIDGQRFESARTVVTGLDLKAIAGVALDFSLYLEGRGADRLISNTDTVDLALPGTESFYTSPPATFGTDW